MMLQDEAEIEALARLFAAEGVKSYLEIGSKFGGSLQRIASVMPVGSRIVSIDMPKGTKAWPQSHTSLEDLILDLGKKGYDARVMFADSQDPMTVKKASWHAPYDAILIDADHRLPGVRKDWLNYGPMGRLIAFHDIAWRRAPEWIGTRIDVPEFWNEIKHGYRHQEFKLCPTGKNNGIGVLWRS
jgi:predicted O-methyltransferase YrrM